MDFEALIREKRDELIHLRPTSGIDLILEHLNAAEKHFENGRRTQEDYLFSDVIYRSNQVFEGILKEAYEVLTGQSAKKLSPFKIETYLSSNDVFSSLVIDYFSRYRTQWRNTSTHDHELRFNEREAFLAISTVVAFCYVAIDQILKKLVANTIEEALSKTIGAQSDGSTEKFVSKLKESMEYVIKEMEKHDLSSNQSSFVYMNGAVAGFCESYWKGDHSISYEQKLSTADNFIRPDIFIEAPDNSYIVELTGFTPNTDNSQYIFNNMTEQLDSMLHYSKAVAAIGIMYPKSNFDQNSNLKLQKVDIENKQIYIIHPVSQQLAN